MYVDDELDARGRTAVVEHLSMCQSCADKLRTLQEDDARRKGTWASLKSPEAARRTCYSAEDLSAYASGLLTLQDAAGIEYHLYTCDGCLGEVMALRRTLHLLKRDTRLAPPDRLVAAVRQGLAGAEQKSVLEKLGTLIIQVATEGLQFIEATLLPEHVRLTVDGHLLPAAAFRSAQEEVAAVAFLAIQQTVRDLALHIGALHEDRETLLLKVQLYKRGKPLARKRVALLGDGRLLYSSETSGSGAVDFPRLSPGEYTIRIPQENVETRIILRSSGETMPVE